MSHEDQVVPDNDRRLFARLASEIDQYLADDGTTPGLFETWPKPPPPLRPNPLPNPTIPSI